VQKRCHYDLSVLGRRTVFVDEAAEEVAAVDSGLRSGSRLRDRSSLVWRVERERAVGAVPVVVGNVDSE
jgi:hypothetical protein